jgi:hypothetical protein
MARAFTLIIFLTFGLNILAQETDYLELLKSENQLKKQFSRLYSDTLSDSDALVDSIRAELRVALAQEGSMDYPWSQLDRIGILQSEDKKLKVFTWHVTDDPDQVRYFGFMQVALKRGKVRLYELKDNFKAQRGVMKLNQSAEDWYGKLYYQILNHNYKRRTYYTLLGMDFNDSRSTIKSVEVITLQRNQPRFAHDMFFNGRDKVDRVVLEYSDRVSISVRYDPELDMITYDHLVPLHPVYERNFEFYAPDGSYDGLEFEGGVWNHRKDIDARNMN